MEITIDLKYRCLKSDDSSKKLRNVRRCHRAIKKNIKIALFDISKTLNNYNWSVMITIVNFLYVDKKYDDEYPVRIDLFSKNSNIEGSLYFINEQNLLSANKILSSLYKSVFYSKDRLNFNKKIFNEDYPAFMVIDNCQKCNDNVLDFDNIENAKITEFKNKYEGFLNYINNKKLYEFKEDTRHCGLQLFYIGREIYWSNNYFDGSYEIPIRTLVRNISECNEDDFIRTLVEAKVININQDIEEVLEWDIKDIFEMSKLIGY